MIVRLLVAAALWGLWAPAGAAAEDLTVLQAMARARSSGREVAVARAQQVADSQRAREARAARIPQLGLQEVWLRTDSPAEAFAFALNQGRFSLSEFSAGDPNHPPPTENALTRLEVTLPLYTGGEVAGRIRQAELAAEAAGDRASWTENGAALAAATAYVRLAQAREQAKLLSGSLDTVRGHVQLAEAYVEQGMLVRSELLRAQVEQARIEELLSEARGKARVAAAALSLRLAVDLATDWQLEPLAEPTPLPGDRHSWLAGAMDRKDLAAARRLLAAGEEEVGVRRSALLPKVVLAGRRDAHGESLFGSSGDSTTWMVAASVDLFAGGRHRAATAAAKARFEAAEINLRQLEEATRLEVLGAYERAVTSRERHGTAMAAVAAAREAERITRERFARGIVKTIDLLDAANALRETETRELVARAEAHLAGFELAVLAGRRPESVFAARQQPTPLDRDGDRQRIPS